MDLRSLPRLAAYSASPGVLPLGVLTRVETRSAFPTPQVVERQGEVRYSLGVQKPISRQRRWQLKMRSLRRCQKCGGKPWRVGGKLCARHRDMERIRQREAYRASRLDSEKRRA